jgi:hypothetical protein
MLLPANFRTRTALDNFSLRYANAQEDYAALKILAPFIVPKSVFKFYIYDQQNSRVEALDAPSGSESPLFDYQVRSVEATAKEYGAKHLVLGKEARDFDRAVADLRQDAVANNMDKMLMHLESAAYTTLTTSGNYASGLSGAAGATWSGGSGDPVEDVRAAREAVKAACLQRPNAIAMSQRALDHLKNHPAIIDRVKYIGMLAPDAVKNAIAALFELDEIVVADAYKLTSAEGATEAASAVWGANAVVYVSDKSQGLRQKSFGRTFMVNQLATQSIDKPELARAGDSAEEVETSWEWVQSFTMVNSAGKATAGYLMTTLY